MTNKPQMPSAFSSYKPIHMQVFGAICIDTSGNLLLVRQRLSKKWSFPKGHRNRGESPLDCAKRELYEEAGIVPQVDYTSTYKMKGGKYFVFQIDSNIPTSINDTVEIDSVEWFPLNNLPPIYTNIDVSIFRSHIKQAFPNNIHNVSTKCIQKYIGSTNSMRSIHNIQLQMNPSTVSFPACF